MLRMSVPFLLITILYSTHQQELRQPLESLPETCYTAKHSVLKRVIYLAVEISTAQKFKTL